MSKVITLNDDEYSLLIISLGKEKTRLERDGFRTLAHRVSDLQAHIKNNAKEKE